MKKINKVLSVFLCLIMALSCFSLAAFAEDVTTPEQAACEHQFNTTVIGATCADKGYTMYVCSNCGYYYKGDYTNSLGHVYGEWTEIRAATCTEEGLMERVCTRSGCSGKETKTIPVLPHVDEDENGLCDVCNVKVEVKFIFSPFEWLKAFIQFLREWFSSIFA